MRSWVLASALVMACQGAVAEEIEYLLPPDWETKPAAEPRAATLSYGKAEFTARFVAAAREVPQCKGIKLSKDHPLMQQIQLNGAKADVFWKGDPQLLSVRFVSNGSQRDDASMRLMMCSAYATVRAAQPDVYDMAGAMEVARSVWTRSKAGPSKTAVAFDVIHAQLTPLQFELRPAN